MDFSNAKLLNIETEYIEELKFNILETLTNSGWFREYNDNITKIIEELESIIAIVTIKKCMHTLWALFEI